MIRENDVFHCRYTEEYRKKNSYSDHCFEGLVIAMRLYNGDLTLVDCFWGVKRIDGYNKVFKLDDEDIILDFYCNLDEIEKSSKVKVHLFIMMRRIM